MPRFSRPDDVFQLRVSLIGIEPSIWRRVLLPQDASLGRVHGVLQAVMGWSDSHLHQFKVGDVRFAEPDKESDRGPIDYRSITLNQIAPRRGSICIYEYDFGDGWEHLVVVEDELPIETVKDRLPRCIGGERACPPEDCGGPHGYTELLNALQNPRHPSHDAFRRWTGGAFDPERFDLEHVNRALLAAPGRLRQGR
jgi:Plasmid pRiA4b ORF-3-like protein